MNREEYSNEILELSDAHKYLSLNLPTGMGKSKAAIDIIKRHSKGIQEYTVLIVVPKNVLKDNWRDELLKWEIPYNVEVRFTTYVSYPKHADRYWNMIILDEGHHFTENCAECTEQFQYDRVLVLSATIPKEIKWRLKGTFPGMYEYSVSAREAIDNEILPDPKVLLIPMMLDNTRIDQTFVKRKSKAGQPVVLAYRERRLQFNYPNKQVHIRCTAQQYYDMLSSDIEWQKQSYMQTQAVFRKNQWLHSCKERLDWLATQKEEYVMQLLELLKDYRTLTFCTSIEQTERFGSNAINSKNKKQSLQHLEDFNEGRIDHITSCAMLNEGMNLVNCQVGIYANIGSSKIVEAQRLGRLLRHRNPMTVIPFFAGTREEEIVTEMLRNYNPTLIRRLFKSQVTKEAIKQTLDGEIET